MIVKFNKGFINFTDKWLQSNVNYFDSLKFVSYKGGCEFKSPFYLFFTENKRSVRNCLDLSSDELWAGLKKNTRNEINKISKNNIIFNVNHFSNEDFILKYNRFIEEKRLKLPLLTLSRLEKYGDNIIFTSTHLDNKWLSIHVYLAFDGYVELLYSITNSDIESKQLGMANRYHHWHDLLKFKADMISTYDWGGIAFGELDGISKFKLSFGGDECTYPIYYSAMYYIALKLSNYAK